MSHERWICISRYTPKFYKCNDTHTFVSLLCKSIISHNLAISTIAFRGGNNLIYKVLHLYYTRYANKYSIILHPSTKIGAGLQFPHNGPIVINAAAVIGENCIIHPCTLIGGDRKTGTPIIGNNVFIGHGSKIIGKISIGNDVFIAPGAILTKDVDDNYIVGSGVNNIIRKTGGKDAYNRYSANKKDYNNS